ncbi:MAG: DUF1549 domain-containing protein [Planctomycetales bacterium]|nr:DUF1549 domain-containing protein [Planctomycetales bacterium]
MRLFSATSVYSVVIILAVAGGATADGVDFAHDVAPILSKHCRMCHGGARAEGDFSLNSRDDVVASGLVVPGSLDDSALWDRIASDDPDLRMPPGDRPALDAAEQAVVRQWIEQGLAWESGYSWGDDDYDPPLAPRRVALPPPADGRVHPIDRLIDAYFSRVGGSRPAAVGDAEFLRRASLDLVGLLPSPAQTQAFLDDASPDKRTQMIDALLERREDYAGHWLTFWNDLLRNAYAGTGFIDGGRQQITEWLYRSLYENKAYDQFARELLSPQPEAAGFIRGIVWRGSVNASQSTPLQFSQNVSQVFLGINMKCASCHDSFIDRWTLEQAYGLAAIYAESSLEIHRCDLPQGRMAKPAWLFPELGQVDAEASQSQRLTQLADLLTCRENGRFSRTIVNRLWHRLMGRGIVHPVDAMQTRPWDEDLLDYLAFEFADQGYDVKKLLRLIATSEIYQAQTPAAGAANGGGNFVFRGPAARRLTAEQFVDALAVVANHRPATETAAFRGDGRSQRGELAAVLKVVAPEVLINGVPDVPTEPAKLVELLGSNESPLRLRAALLPQDPLQRSLGRPGREQTVTSRPVELTTLEAMTLANGAELATILTAGGAQLAETHHGDAVKIVEQVYWQALSRRPTAEELDAAQRIMGGSQTSAEAAADFLWCVIMLPEFQMIR